MKKTKTSKKNQNKPKANARKTVVTKSNRAAKNKPAAKAKAALKVRAGASKPTPNKKARRASPTVQVGSQSVETMQMKPKARVARAGAGGGDFGGASVVEDVDSQSADELLEEGQAFEAGIVRGVEQADDNIEQEVHTHEVPQDDVPGEYGDKDRP
jgi:hypothetical protein